MATKQSTQGRGFSGKLADPEVRAARARAANEAAQRTHAFNRSPEGMALKLLEVIDEVPAGVKERLADALNSSTQKTS